MKVSAKINTAKYQDFTFCSFTVLNKLKPLNLTLVSCKALSLLRTLNEQKEKC